MANETAIAKGASYTSIISSAAVSAGQVSLESSSIATALGATEEVYSMLDFKLDITAGTVTAGVTIDLHRRPGDGTDKSPAITTSYLKNFIGSFEVSGAADEYYIYNVPNYDENDTFYLMNNMASSTTTMQLYVRGKTYGT